MKKIFFFLLFSRSLFAQSDAYDEIKAQYDRLCKESKFDSALVFAKDMNTLAFKNEGDTSLRYAVSYRFLGNCHVNLQNSDSALFYWNKSLETLGTQNRSENLDAAHCYNNMGLLYSDMGDYKAAEPYYKQAAEIRKQALGEEHPDYASSLNDLGSLYSNMGNYKTAERYYKQALEIYKKALGGEHPDYVSSLNSLGILFYEMSDYKAAEPYYKQALEIRKKSLGEEHPDYASSLNNLGNLYERMGNYKSAEPYYKQSLEIRKKTLGEEHPDYASSLNNLGNLYKKMGNYKSAEPYYKQSLEIRKKTLGEEHPDYASSLNNLGALYWNLGDYISAEPYYKQSLEIRKKTFGEEHPSYVESLNNLGNLYDRMGIYKSAEPYYKQSLEISKKTFGEEHPSYALSLNNLGILYSEMGDYKSAEPYYKQSLEIRKKTFGEEHPSYASSLTNLGMLYETMGNHESAESYYKQSLAIRKKTLGEEHPKYAFSLNNLGDLFFYKGDYISAELYYKQSLEIRKKTLGEEHPDYASSLSHLGMLYETIGNYESAESYYKQSLEIRKKTLGEEHPKYASSLSHLGMLNLNVGNYESAESYYKQSLEIRKKTLGEEHPEYAFSLNNLGNLYLNVGNYKAALPFYNQALRVNISNLTINFSWLSSQEKEVYWQQKKDFYEFMNSFSFSAYDSVPYATELSYNVNLISKSLLLETSRELDQAITESNDDEMKAQFMELKQLRRTYSKIQSEGLENIEIMVSLKSQADSLDKILVNKLGDYAASKIKFEITWKEVQASLKNLEVAIEFSEIYDYSDNLNKYMAFVLRPGYEYPKLVKLGDEESINDAVNNKDFASLYKLIWKDLDSLLVGVKTVYYSPAGVLNNVAFSVLCYDGAQTIAKNEINSTRGVITEEQSSKSCNTYLMDKYEIHQLATTRYLTDGSLKKEKPKNASVALLGGINYDELPIIADSVIKEESNEDFALQTNLSNLKNRLANKKKRSSSSFGKKMDYLPGTKTEINNIAYLLKDKKWKINSLSEKNASEHSFKKDIEMEAPSVLHIATHGFAFPDEIKKEKKLIDIEQKSTYKISENPMVRCGLMLSGSNISWTGNPKKMIEETGDDGILTAAEVSNLDLSKTKLVVLSACETGLGKIEGSEGTFGLKRGFKLAGVEQIIVSLWSVPDKETMELMTLFYDDLAKTLNPVSSFEKAQKEMRMKYPTEPSKWAGFVLVR